MKGFLPKFYSAGSACIIVAFLDIFGCVKLSHFLLPVGNTSFYVGFRRELEWKKYGTLSENVCEDILILGTHFS